MAKALQIIKEKFAGGDSTALLPSNLAEVLQGQFMCYFGDQEDETAITEILADVNSHSGTFRIFHDGIIRVSQWSRSGLRSSGAELCQSQCSRLSKRSAQLAA